jgi:hypothetical protein
MYDLVGLSEEEIRKRDAPLEQQQPQQSLEVSDNEADKVNEDELI